MFYYVDTACLAGADSQNTNTPWVLNARIATIQAGYTKIADKNLQSGCCNKVTYRQVEFYT